MGLRKKKPDKKPERSFGILDSRNLDAAITALSGQLSIEKGNAWGSDSDIYGNQYGYHVSPGGTSLWHMPGAAMASPAPITVPVPDFPMVSAALDEFSPDAGIPWRCTLCGERSPEAVIVMGTKPDTFWTEWACGPCREKVQRWKLPCVAAVRGSGRSVTIDGMVSSGPLPDWCGMEDCRQEAAVIVSAGGTCGTEYRRPMCRDCADASVQSPPQADYCPEPHPAKFIRVVTADGSSPGSFKWL